jgi:pimeloyl-ACP methyl ester carboxylesterase
MKGTTFVLIPGAGGSAWYWHLVAPILQKQGQEVIAVDLPAADDRAGLLQYADAVVDAIGNRNPREVVLVAQSLAGFTAPIICQMMPIGLLVLVNAMIPNPGETPGEWWNNTGQPDAKRQADERDGRDPEAPFDPLTYFFHDVPKPVIDDAWAQGEPRQSETVFGSPCTIDAWPQVHSRVLVGRDDRFFPAQFQRRVAQERLGVFADEMPGGHLVALSQPAGLSARLLGYVDGRNAD